MTALGLAAALPFNQTKGDPLLSLGPVFAIRAKDSIPGEQWALNKGTGGQVLRARYGSVGRAEIRRGIGAIFPGTTTNYISVPDAANLRLTQDIDIAVRYTLESLAPATWQSLACRWYGGADRSFQFAISSGGSGLLAFQRTGDGTTVDSLTSTNSLTANGLVVGTTYWFRARTSGTILTFEWAPDSPDKPTSWNAFGGTRTLAGSTFWAGTAPFWVGVNTSISNDPVSGAVKRVVYGSYGGTTVLDVDFTNQPDLTTSFTCTTGQTVTVTATNAVDTNDPLLATAGENYIYIPSGSSSNNAYIPSAANLSATTQFEIIQRVWLADWTPATTSILGQRTAFTDPNYHWSLALLIGGQLRLTIFPSATVASAIQIDSTTSVPLTDGQWYWLRVTFNGNDGSGNRRTNFYYSADRASVPTSWIAIGTEVVTASTVVFTDPGSSTLFAVGANPSAPDVACKRFIYRTTIDGSNIVDIDFSLNSNQSSFVCTTGQTVTIGRNTSGRKTVVVTQPVWLFGTDDYLEVLDNDLLDFNNIDHTVLVITRWWDTAITYGAIVVKNQTAPFNDGWTLAQNNGSGIFPMYFEDEVGSIDVMGCDNIATQGQLFLFAGIREGTVNKNYVNNSMTSVSAPDVSDLRNSGVMRIGSTPFNAYYADMELFAVYIFRKALTAAEIAAGVQYWNAA